MLQSEAGKRVFAKFLAEWPAPAAAIVGATVPYSFDNNVVPEVVPHARVALISLDSEQYTLGPRKKMYRPGFIEVRIVDQVGRGRDRADRLAEVVRNIFETKRFGADVDGIGIVTHATSVSEQRRDRDSPQLWMILATTPFEFYSIRGPGGV